MLHAIDGRRRCKSFLCANLFNLIGVLCVEQHDTLAEMLFNIFAYVHRLIGIDEIDGDAVLAESARASNAMQVSFAISISTLIDRQIKVHNNVHLIDIDTARQDVGGDENLLMTFPEPIKNRQSLIDSKIS